MSLQDSIAEAKLIENSLNKELIESLIERRLFNTSITEKSILQLFERVEKLEKEKDNG